MSCIYGFAKRGRRGLALMLPALFFIFAGLAHAQIDMLVFMDSTLPEDEYVAVHAEHRDTAQDPWQAVTGVYQPFKSRVNWGWGQVYWRKDNLAGDYYGELFTFDASTIFLHAETFPAKTSVDPPGQPAWDDRYDRFRLFVHDGQGWGWGREIAPVSGSTNWTYSGLVDTYICNNFTEYNNGTAPQWQNNVSDYVTISRYNNFSTVFDGVCSGWPADTAFQTFDEVIVINQHMNNNAGRERFFFAREGSEYYGIVRWDNSLMQNGQWVVVDRTVGLTLGTRATGLSFGGFYRRAREDKHLLSAPKVNTGDVNGDFVSDIQIVNGTGGMYAGICNNVAQITSTPDMNNPWGAALSSQQSWNKPLGVGDMNGDGYADVVFVNGSGNIYAGGCGAAGTIVAALGVGNPWGAALTSQQSWNKPLGVGDVNGDGFADYVFINGTGGIYAGLGYSDLQQISTFQIGNPWGAAFTSQQSWNKPLGVGDIDGNGYADYVFVNGTGDIWAGLSDGTGLTSTRQITHYWGAALSSQQSLNKPLAVADFNGDEYADIAYIDDIGIIYVGLCDGNEIFSTVTMNNPWGGGFTSQGTWVVGMQQGFGWGYWF